MLEMLVTLLMVSWIGLSVQTQVWRHWRWIAQQQLQTVAVLQMRNFIQQGLVTPATLQEELFQHWQQQHAQVLPGSRSHWQRRAEGLSVALGWPVAGDSEPSPRCQQAGVAMPQCLIF